MSEVALPLLLALADDELVLGHRHSEWTGWAPHIEEDVAFSSIAQDEIGHAAALYALAGRITGRAADELAFGRSPEEYTHALFCERPNGDWAYTVARHWFYDTADELRLEALRTSSNEGLAQLATKMLREERYHMIHADLWMERIAHGPLEGRTKLAHAVTATFADALGLFEPIEREAEALEEGLLSTPSSELRRRFVEKVTEQLDELGLPGASAPQEHRGEFEASSSGDLIESEQAGSTGPAPDGSGGRTGRHTEDFATLWTVMTKTFRDDPGATW